MKIFFTLFKKELSEIVRTKKLLILIIIFAFTAISSPILAKLIPTLLKSVNTEGIVFNIPEPTWRDAIDQLVKNTAQFGFLVIILMFSGAIAEEKNKKTLEMVLTKPISRPSFILAKLCAAAGSIKIIFIFSAVVFYFYTASLFQTFSVLNYFWLCLFLLIYLLLILSVTILASTIFASQITAAGVTLIASIAFTVIAGNIDRIAKYAPDYILSHYKNLMTDGKIADFLPSVLFSLVLIIIATLISIFVFKNQEIER